MELPPAKEMPQEDSASRIEAAGVRDFQQIVAQGITRIAPRMERNRSHGKPGEEPELQGRSNRQQQERPAVDSGTVRFWT